MKKISSVTLALILSCSLAIVASCKKSETAPEQTQPSASTPSKAAPVGTIQSAEKNSFQEVTSHLDPGGNLYLYFSTEQLLNNISAKADNVRQLISAIPDVKDDDRENIEKAINIVTNLIKSSGIED